MSKVDNPLKALGIELLSPKLAVVNYPGCKGSGDMLYLSGRVSEPPALGEAALQLAKHMVRNGCKHQNKR